ncbi:MAG TPA: sugar phosphate isomerase/epimerase family protein [candidate division Zixibacteria bacterium]|nr:sugar phosphate isomerase/epimerase family protein [candidate division Zixibacteria bacterium]
MLRAISTYVHIRERLHPGLLDGFVRGGAQAVEVFAARGHFDYTNPQSVRELASYFRSTEGISFHSMHAPMFADEQWGRFHQLLNLVAPERKDRIAAMDEIKRAIEVAEQAPFRFLIVHLGDANETADQRKFDEGLTAVEHLRAFARPLGVQILLENIPNELTTAEQLSQLIRVSHFDDVGVCFDFGHARIGAGVRATFEPLKHLIRSTHVHDNDGTRDAHLVPGEGSIDWTEAMELLRAAPQIPAVLLELEGDPDGSPEFSRKVPQMAQKAWDVLKP